jgi:hypothetical protein
MNDDDGGEVAEPRNPDTIQREIEQTRAELADTIDAIADRISPRRAASRGAHAVKAQVSSVFNGGGGAAVPAEPAARNGGATYTGTSYTGTSEFSVSRRLRADRVLLAVGVLAAAAGAVVLWRSRD